ncbi:D-arabitol-phosphate dehydrogenase [Maioricimonas rarisocia]|uniref:D-arabitol-phosphate dehydrogenase n=1 Tax=Maioricimonas rarisocia TaxID=2528026 RepID=A0A517ZC85_9PLAN|nr:alcohol dehydrogenase catalytic domain-containing protein [Maioricimonas rarisocia]QDU40098.1 D-arabitol-phosphate dehydrogenase [Maioricimonas rarisocia]
MAAIVLRDGQTVFDPEYVARPRHSGEVPVRVTTAGICETDLQLIRGYMGFEGVLGHEFVGIAESGRHAGQRVVGEINCSCGECEACHGGRGNHCPHRTVLGILDHDGAFADVVYVPEGNLHAVPKQISDDAAVFVEPLAAAFQIPAQVDLSWLRRATVLGDGRLGNLCAQVLRLQGCDVEVIGKHAEKLALIDELGIRSRLLSEITLGPTADLVVDCTGSESGLQTAMQLVRPRGTIVLKTTTAAPSGPNLAPLVIDEVTLVGSRCGPFPAAIEALAAGQIQVAPLISGRYPLAEGVEALDRASRRTHLKVLLDVN